MRSKYNTFKYKVKGIDGTHEIFAKDNIQAIEMACDFWDCNWDDVELI